MPNKGSACKHRKIFKHPTLPFTECRSIDTKSFKISGLPIGDQRRHHFANNLLGNDHQFVSPTSRILFKKREKVTEMLDFSISDQDVWFFYHCLGFSFVSRKVGRQKSVL